MSKTMKYVPSGPFPAPQRREALARAVRCLGGAGESHVATDAGDGPWGRVPSGAADSNSKHDDGTLPEVQQRLSGAGAVLVLVVLLLAPLLVPVLVLSCWRWRWRR